MIIVGRVFNQEYSGIRQWQYPTYPVQHQMNISHDSVAYSQPYSSQMRQFLPPYQWPQPHQQNYNTLVGRSNMEQHSLGIAPHLLPSMPADHMIPSSSVVTTVAISTPVLSTLHSSSYTYSQTTTVGTIMTTVQCGNSSQHRSVYSVCDHPTNVASFQVGLQIHSCYLTQVC